MARTKLESDFNTHLKDRLNFLFPGCEIIKQDPSSSYQGVPDHLVLFRRKWALLESKRGAKAKQQPNQGYHINRLNDIGFASFINPTNCEEVLAALEIYFYEY